MANLVTLSDIRTQAQQHADMENSDFVSDSEWLFYINQAYAELYDILVSKFEDYYTDSYSYTVPSGEYTIPLPSDFYKLRRLDYSTGSGDDEWYTVLKYNFTEGNWKNNRVLTTWSNRIPIEYRLIKNTIKLLPEQSSNGNYRLWYVPSFTRLADDSDTVDGVNGWEDYIIIKAAIYALTKEETDTTVLQAALAQLRERIENMSQNRDAGLPEKITDISRLRFDSDRLF